jgi:membrane-associated phospholipid phosphatase
VERAVAWWVGRFRVATHPEPGASRTILLHRLVMMRVMTLRHWVLGRWGAVSAPWRVLAVGGLLALLLTLLGAEVLDNVLEGEGVAGLDQPVLRFAVEHRSPGWTRAFVDATILGSTVVLTVASVLVSGFALLRRRWVDAGLVAVAALGSGVLVVAGKSVVGRRRPPGVTQLVTEQTLAFPSGHAMGTSVFAVIVVSLVLAGGPRRSVRWLAVGVAAVVVLVVGASRVYLGVHWVTDVLGGWLVGGAWATVCVTTASQLRLRRAQAAMS